MTWLVLGLLAILAAFIGAFYAHEKQREDATRVALVRQVERPPLTLFSSLPIYFGETASIAGALNDDAKPHWLKDWLEAHYTLNTVDSLVMNGSQTINASEHLLIAQPRALTGDENVGLDNWVRDGGRVAIFADPMLTWESQFAIGDKRRPMDVALVSPILNHWGLELRYDDEQPEGPRVVPLDGQHDLFVDQAGTLAKMPNGQADCNLQGNVVALCRVGKGVALIVADAAVLEPADDQKERTIRQRAVAELLDEAFGPN